MILGFNLSFVTWAPGMVAVKLKLRTRHIFFTTEIDITHLTNRSNLQLSEVIKKRDVAFLKNLSYKRFEFQPLVLLLFRYPPQKVV